MTTLCPKCQYSRRASETAPDWQCPSCGVAYSKATEATRGQPPILSRPAEAGVPWGKGLALAVLVAAVWFGWQGLRMQMRPGPSRADVALLAAGVKEGEIVMFTTASCGPCHQAAAWLSQNGFLFTNCDLDSEPACRMAFRSYRATGTPYLVVRGHHMKEGFGSDEFFVALQRAPGPAKVGQVPQGGGG